MGVVVDERVKVAPVIVIAHEIDSPVAEVALRANKGCSLLVGFGAIGDPDGGGYGVRGTIALVRGPEPHHAQSVMAQRDRDCTTRAEMRSKA